MLNKVIRVGPNLIGQVSLLEEGERPEGSPHMHTEERPYEDTVRRWPSESREERPHPKPILAAP